MPNPLWPILQPRLRESLLTPMEAVGMAFWVSAPFRHKLDRGQEGAGRIKQRSGDSSAKYLHRPDSRMA